MLKQPRIKDKPHVKFVSELPCVITGAENGVQSHHLLRDVMQRIIRGGGMRAEDCYVIPLHFSKHTELHLDGNETRYLMENGIHHPVELALTLYEHTGDHEWCERLVREWKI